MESSMQDDNLGSGCDSRLILIMVVVIIIVFIIFRFNRVENMSPGVVTQMFAQDAQDTYLKGNVDQLATGNYLLNWNQPTRLATGSYYYTTGPNRGALLKNLCYKCKKQECECKDGPVYYPMGYPGDYFEFPTPDINYPLPYIVSNGGFVREGFSDNYLTENFSDNMAKLKLYYADWCGHCKRFKPIFDGDLKNKIEKLNIPVKLVPVDCTTDNEEANKNGVTGYPTLILEANNKSTIYEGVREPDQIIKFIKKYMNGDFVKEEINNNMAKLKLYYADWCGHCKRFKPIFDGDLKNKIEKLNMPVKLVPVDCTTDNEEANKNGVEGYPTLILEANNKSTIYEGEREPNKIIEFIKKYMNGNFVKEEINNNMAKLKLYYADWCGHCKRFKPIFDGDLKNRIEKLNIPIKLVPVDCTTDNEEANKNGVEGYPTLILEANNKSTIYEGVREPNKIIEFIRREMNM